MASSTHRSCNLGTFIPRFYSISPNVDLLQWQSMITHRGPYDACTGVQLLITALLGQVYGALSKVNYPTLQPVTYAKVGTESRYPHHKSGLSTPWLLLGKALRNVR